MYAERLEFVAEGAVIACHERRITRDRSGLGHTFYDWRHYLTVLQRKPGALRNGAPFTELPEAFRRLQGILLKRPGGDREMAEILALVLLHDEREVLKAVEQALEMGQASKQHVLNCLSRLNEPQRPRPLRPPAALRLVNEPVANTARYDGLFGGRGGGHEH